MVEKVASPFMLEPHWKAMGNLTASISAASQVLSQKHTRQPEKTAVLSAGFRHRHGSRSNGVG